MRFLEKVVDQRPTVSSLAESSKPEENNHNENVINQFYDQIESENTTNVSASKSTVSTKIILPKGK